MPRFRPTRLVAMLALVLTAAVIQPLVSSAEAAVPTPQTRTFTAPIEAPGGYEGQTFCDPVARPGVNAVKSLLLKTYGDRVIYIPRYGCSGVSEHHEGRALDWMISARVASQKATAESFIAWLQKKDQWGHANAMAARMGVMYVIWNNKMWRAYDPGRGWTEYKSCSTRTSTGNDTECHRNHVHISFTWDGAMAKTSFYTGKVLNAGGTCGPLGTSTVGSAAPTDQRFVPVRPTRILETSSGLGTAGGTPCRMQQDSYAGQARRVDLQVTGRAGVPTSGVSAAVLSVRVATNAPANIFAWPTGATKPGTVQVSAAAGAEGRAMVVAPLGKGGRVSLATSLGAQWVSVDVLGYYTPDAGMLFNPLNPWRSQVAVRLAPGQQRTVTAGGRLGVPSSGVGALSLSVTTAGVDAGGALRIKAVGGQDPASDTVAYLKAVSRTASVVTKSSTAGGIVITNTSTTASVTVSVDVTGYYAATGLSYASTRGAKVLDTRSGTGVSGPLTSGRIVSFPVRGVAGVPTAAKAVALQLYAIQPAGVSSTTLWASGATKPDGRQFVTEKDGSTAQYVVVPIGSDGRVSMRGAGASVNYVATVVGWWTPTTRVGAITGIGLATPPATSTSSKVFAVSARLGSTSIVLPTRTSVSGTVLPQASARGKKVVVQRLVGGKWTTVAVATTGRDGRFTAAMPTSPLGASTYRVWKSSESCSKSRCAVKGAGSAVVRLTTGKRFAVGLVASRKVVARGTSVTLSGSLGPAPKGSKVTIQRLVGRSWKSVGTTVVGSNGRFTFGVRHTSAGSFTYRAWKPSASCTKGSCLLVTAASPKVVLTVR